MYVRYTQSKPFAGRARRLRVLASSISEQVANNYQFKAGGHLLKQ